MKWEKLPVLPGRGNPCLHCPDIEPHLHPEAFIAVGFGQAYVSRDEEMVWSEQDAEHNATTRPCSACNGVKREGVVCGGCADEGTITDVDYWQMADAEKAAALDPDHDWRITKFGPLHGEVYQRQGEGRWLLVESNQGFA